MKKILIVGSTSAIAKAAARLWGARGDELFLAARDGAKLEGFAAELRKAGANVAGVVTLDINDLARHEVLLDTADGALGGVDVLLMAHGVLPDQEGCEADPARAVTAFRTNAESAMAFLLLAADRFEAHRGGTLAVITSVAGMRGRPSNYVYGASKAAMMAFLGGLRARLWKAGVRVLDIRPGPVETPMTAHLPKGRGWAAPEAVGAGIVRAVDRGADIVYLPWWWRFVMMGVKAVPEGIFKRLNT
ncbi:MAG: SDR family oxidoreductase [Planctomycetota bacterium]